MTMTTPRIVRTLTADVIEMTAEGFDFEGCDSRHSDYCACATWTPTHCTECDQEIVDGELIHAIKMPTNPYFDMLSMDQEWEETTWHVECPEPEES